VLVPASCLHASRACRNSNTASSCVPSNPQLLKPTTASGPIRLCFTNQDHGGHLRDAVALEQPASRRVCSGSEIRHSDMVRKLPTWPFTPFDLSLVYTRIQEQRQTHPDSSMPMIKLLCTSAGYGNSLRARPRRRADGCCAQGTCGCPRCASSRKGGAGDGLPVREWQLQQHLHGASMCALRPEHQAALYSFV
jgi:hypothetical protein